MFVRINQRLKSKKVEVKNGMKKWGILIDENWRELAEIILTNIRRTNAVINQCCTHAL